jgi:hypothetical protein
MLNARLKKLVAERDLEIEIMEEIAGHDGIAGRTGGAALRGPPDRARQGQAGGRVHDGGPRDGLRRLAGPAEARTSG